MIAVLDYGIGNLASAAKALQKVGADARLCSRPSEAGDAEALVVPGVGAFGACMGALTARGLGEAVGKAVADGRPVLGICVGFQMLFEGSEEDPGVSGLGVLRGTVRRLSDSVKRPQMQWNQLIGRSDTRMLAGLGIEPWVYFVHSFAPVPEPPDDDIVIAHCDYGGPVVAAIERGPLWGCQFHPEKSGRTGLDILANFARFVAA